MSIFYLCIKIFFIRIIDVTLGTLRTIVTIKDKILLASTIGFFEVLIWFLIAREALEINDNAIIIGISYALGFGAGTYIGGIISRILIKGRLSVQIITNNASQKWVENLRENGFAVSVIDINHKKEEPDKYMFFLEINQTDFDKLHKLIKKYDKDAFIVANESKNVINGYFNHK